MAVSYRIAIFLIALSVFGLVYALLMEPASMLEETAMQFIDGEDAMEGAGYQSTLWTFLPVFALIAAGGWLIKQSVIGK